MTPNIYSIPAFWRGARATTIDHDDDLREIEKWVEDKKVLVLCPAFQRWKARAAQPRFTRRFL